MKKKHSLWDNKKKWLVFLFYFFLKVLNMVLENTGKRLLISSLDKAELLDVQMFLASKGVSASLEHKSLYVKGKDRNKAYLLLNTMKRNQSSLFD